MNVLIAFAILIVLTHASILDRNLWTEFKGNHSKVYNVAEDDLRFRVFQKNLRRIEKHNDQYKKGAESYFLAITQFADWTSKEFKAMLTAQATYKPSFNYTGTFVADPNFVDADSVDWRKSNAVTAVKNQGQCGSCWSFSITGGLEGQLGIHKKKLVSLSEQELIDCSKTSFGCNGGYVDKGYKFVSRNGLSSEKQYPYKAKNGKCSKIPKKALNKISGFKSVGHNEAKLKSAVGSVGPVSVIVDANKWQHYGGGVFNNANCGNGQNHAVLVVGYASNYWIIKNSWAKHWGEAGYMRLIRGKNLCGVSKHAYYPVL